VPLKVFVSSTTEDLELYRKTACDMVLKLGQHPESMEQFVATSSKAVVTCRRKVLECNVLIVILGHRYGWIPPSPSQAPEVWKDPDLRGDRQLKRECDGETCITWMEVNWALGAKPRKPVLPFIVHDDAVWTESREQDNLLDAQTQEDAINVWNNTKRLKEFRRDLQGRATPFYFRNEFELGMGVLASLAQLLFDHKGGRESEGMIRDLTEPRSPWQ
jgi:hypothetical protein